MKITLTHCSNRLAVASEKKNQTISHFGQVDRKRKKKYTKSTTAANLTIHVPHEALHSIWNRISWRLLCSYHILFHVWFFITSFTIHMYIRKHDNAMQSVYEKAKKKAKSVSKSLNEMKLCFRFDFILCLNWIAPWLFAHRVQSN